jgi:hypothetical protein
MRCGALALIVCCAIGGDEVTEEKPVRRFQIDGGKGLTGKELGEIEDAGVKFGMMFKPRVTGLGTDELPKVSRKADGLGQEWEGRQIFRLVAVTSAPEPPPDRK